MVFDKLPPFLGIVEKSGEVGGMDLSGGKLVITPFSHFCRQHRPLSMAAPLGSELMVTFFSR